MKKWFLIWLGLGLGQMMANDMRFYIGTYTTKGTPGGIWTSQLNGETGELSAPELAAEAENPTFLALAPNGRFLYAALEAREGAVLALAVEPDGKLRGLNQQPAGSGTCYVSVDPSGKNVLAANYSSGSVAVFPVADNGSLDARSAQIPFTGSGPSPRQKQSYGHAFDAFGDFAYACDLGSDSVWSFRLDAAKGTLTPLDPPAAKVPTGSGPRHLAFEAKGRFVYVMNELTLGVTVFSRDTTSGTLTPIQTISTLPEGTVVEGATGAEIALHPSGKWLYVSNRKHDSLTVFAVAADGTLSWVENVPAGVKGPRSFTLDPSGNWLLAAGQSDNRIVVFQVNPDSGKLTPTDHSLNLSQPVCLLFSR